MIYFDNAATTLIKPKEVKEAVLNAMDSCTSVGRSGHKYSQNADKIVFECRENAAELFNYSKAENIIFTYNATHSLNIAIRSLVKRGDHVLISGFEHNAVLRPLYAIGANVSVFGTRLFDREYSIISLRKKITPKTKCVIVNHVSNVFGFIQPIYEIAEVCRQKRIPLIIDASQSAGILDIDENLLNASFIAMPGHKSLFGMQGTGILLCNSRNTPIIYGGTGSLSKNRGMPDFLPDRLEAGTHNVAGIAGLNEGIKFVIKNGTKNIFEHEQILKSKFINEVSKIKNIRVFHSEKHDVQSGVISIVCKNIDPETTAQKLGEFDICVRAGFHCAPLAHKFAKTYETGTIRVSFSCFNTEDEISEFCDIMRFITKNAHS